MRICEVEGCKSEAKFALYRTRDGKKEWLQVCGNCERKIGDENMRRLKDVRDKG